MSILVFVYRSSLGDCTNGGPSSHEDQFVVENVEGSFSNSQLPKMELVVDNLGNLRLIPTELKDKNPMFGGNFAGTSDSRWSKELKKLVGYDPRVVPIFDRVE